MILKIIHEVLFKALLILNFELQRQRDTDVDLLFADSLPTWLHQSLLSQAEARGFFCIPRPRRAGTQTIGPSSPASTRLWAGSRIGKGVVGDQLVPIWDTGVWVGGSFIHCATMLVPSFLAWRNNPWSTFTEIWIFLIKYLHLNSEFINLKHLTFKNYFA